jgi:hypothetical protein
LYPQIKIHVKVGITIVPLQRILIALFLLAILAGCAPAPTEEIGPTPTLTSTPIPTDTPTSTPTIIPTAIPYGGGQDNARVALFTELEPDENVAGYIRVADVDVSKEKLKFSDVKLMVGTKPGSLSSTGYHERYPPLIRWSPDGNYLSYTWFEDGKGILYIYDYPVQKLKWEIELRSNNPYTLHFTLLWSADSKWVFIEVDAKSYYILDVVNGTINDFADTKNTKCRMARKSDFITFREFWANGVLSI